MFSVDFALLSNAQLGVYKGCSKRERQGAACDFSDASKSRHRQSPELNLIVIRRPRILKEHWRESIKGEDASQVNSRSRDFIVIIGVVHATFHLPPVCLLRSGFVLTPLNSVRSGKNQTLSIC
jgi:hypothetical protein